MPAFKKLFGAFLCSTITQIAAVGAEFNVPENILFESGIEYANRDSYNPLLIKLAGRGYVAVSTSYRLAPKYQFPAAIFDVKAAVRWLKANAGLYQIDPDRIGVTGDSAGGHLAQFLGVTAAGKMGSPRKIRQ